MALKHAKQPYHISKLRLFLGDKGGGTYVHFHGAIAGTGAATRENSVSLVSCFHAFHTIWNIFANFFSVKFFTPGVCMMYDVITVNPAKFH